MIPFILYFSVYYDTIIFIHFMREPTDVLLVITVHSHQARRGDMIQYKVNVETGIGRIFHRENPWQDLIFSATLLPSTGERVHVDLQRDTFAGVQIFKLCRELMTANQRSTTWPLTCATQQPISVQPAKRSLQCSQGWTAAWRRKWLLPFATPGAL